MTSEDIKLEKIGKFLERGGTMLAQHCECGAPLFRYQGNTICPICDGDDNEKEKETKDKIPEAPRTAPQVSPVTEIPSSAETAPSIPPSSSVGTVSTGISGETKEFIKNTLVNKIVQLCLDLQRETDLTRTKQQIEAIESGTRALNNLKT